MNSVEKVLYEELTHLVDRLATSVPEGSVAAAAASNLSLRKRLDEADAQLASARAALLEDYAAGVARWRTSRTFGRWPRGVGQLRPKRRASRPRRSRPDSSISGGAAPWSVVGSLR